MSGHSNKIVAGAEGPIIPNVDLVAILVNMGVTKENAAKFDRKLHANIQFQALVKTGNVSAELAARWIFENRDSICSTAILRAPSLGLDDADAPKGHRMVLVVNVGLTMSSRKLATQVVHASLGVYRAMMIEEERFGKMLLRWEECGEKVVVLQETGSHALMELGRQAGLYGLPYFLVDDSSKTQGTPGSVTVLGMLGTTEKVEKVIGSLQPL